MGGGFYDRDVQVASTPAGFSSAAQETLKQRSQHPDTVARGRDLVCNASSAVVVAIDVTGSMGNWSKIIYDKLPMFYGQLRMQGYLAEPELSFAAVGDAMTDKAPLQVTRFASGTDLDTEIAKLWLEGGGGANQHESYALCGYFYARHATFSHLEPGTKPFLFFTGDESFRETVPVSHITRLVSDHEERITCATCGAAKTTECFSKAQRSHENPRCRECCGQPTSVSHFVGRMQGRKLPDVNTHHLFQELKEKYHVFLLHKPFRNEKQNQTFLTRWRDLIGPENVLEMHEPKAVVDVMLGAIAMVSGARDMASYMVDLDTRGQSAERQTEVQGALRGLAERRRAPAAPAAAAPVAAGGGNEEALRAELEAARKEIEMLKLQKELEAAKKEIADLKSK